VELSGRAIGSVAEYEELRKMRTWWRDAIRPLGRASHVIVASVYIRMAGFPRRSSELLKLAGDCARQARKATAHPPVGWDLVAEKLRVAADRLYAECHHTRAQVDAGKPVVLQTADAGETLEKTETERAIDGAWAAAVARYVIDGGAADDIPNVPSMVDELVAVALAGG